jgi:structural maintenance of chromosome 2
MIKNVFPDSQFIVVSLKEGMFQNANVLFSTRFEDGTSMVSRTSGAEQSIDKQEKKRARAEPTRE